jgi:hypothetical protein
LRRFVRKKVDRSDWTGVYYSVSASGADVVAARRRWRPIALTQGGGCLFLDNKNHTLAMIATGVRSDGARLGFLEEKQASALLFSPTQKRRR